jgi:hypothetical protein
MILYLYIIIVNNKIIKIHSEMKNEVVTLLKAIGIVVVGVLLANTLERKLLSSKVDAPMVAPTKE